jgi:hypothetical protein
MSEVKFLSPVRTNQRIVVEPAISEVAIHHDQGGRREVTRQDEGVHAQFVRGEFRTTDPEVVEALAMHPLYGLPRGFRAADSRHVERVVNELREQRDDEEAH